ncbi:hypothetical protein [Rufibacter latericius]|uniref:DUF3592 domain-containing protein n=1 Tax=Rufibacter latericius TaxID=2487040 RepID=A0A3M9MTM3_9BACT|nr:hypothetical protein [Rufibacter latericius]RNI28861.1 hypothetical protein EFB08_09565 [Rufibacter latericius]
MPIRSRRTLGVPTFSLPLSGQFMPAILLIIVGLGLLIFKSLTQEVKTEQELVVKEGTFINYSFKKTPEGERDYGIWLKEFAERFELTGREEANFDTAAFRAAIKPGDRLRVEYSNKEDLLENGGVRKLYGLTAPSKNLQFFLGKDIVAKENSGVLTYAIYGFLTFGIGLYLWQLYKSQRQRSPYEE